MQQLRNFIYGINRSLTADAVMTALVLVLLAVTLRRPFLQWLRDPTFRLDSGESVTFRVGEADCAQLTEGTRGDLTYQGTRFHGFGREADRI